MSELYDNFKRSNIQIIGTPEEVRGENRELVVKEIIAENFPILRTEAQIHMANFILLPW